MKLARYNSLVLALVFLLNTGAAEAGPMYLEGPTNNLVGSGSIDTVGEIDEWIFNSLVPNGEVSATGDPDSSALQLVLTLMDPMGSIIASSTASTAGSNAEFFNVSIANAGRYTLTVQDNSNGTGAYNLSVTGSNGATIQGVPEPTTLTLFGLGLAGLGWSRRKKA